MSFIFFCMMTFIGTFLLPNPRHAISVYSINNHNCIVSFSKPLINTIDSQNQTKPFPKHIINHSQFDLSRSLQLQHQVYSIQNNDCIIPKAFDHPNPLINTIGRQKENKAFPKHMMNSHSNSPLEIANPLPCPLLSCSYPF